MLIVGITGGIGSGKSLIAKLLVTMGYPVYDSDYEAKQIMQSDPLVINELRQAFGEQVFSQGTLDRQKLATEVFTCPEKLLQLNAIVHPAVKRHFRLWTTRQHSMLCFLETAILFESGFNSETDKIILVTAPLDIRIERVVQRDGCTRSQVQQRIAQQWSEEDKALKSDYITVNDGAHSVIKQTEKIILQLTQP